MTETKFGTLEELLEITPDHLRPIIVYLRDIILEIYPEACEVVRMGDRAVTFGVGPKKNTEGYVYLMPHAKWINLGFFQGTVLKDPANLLQGTGAKMRHIKIKTLADIDQASIRTLVQQAVAERSNAQMS